MYKVLLVDDEPLSLEGLEKLVPWSRYGMTIAASVNSAFAALSYLEEQEPVDLLITDIRMPIMSGIELIGRVRERHPAMKLLLISGYEDFQYARNAILMNVSAYILKPVDRAELLGILERLKAELDEEHARKHLYAKYADSLPVIRNEQLRLWLQGMAEPEAVRDIVNEFRLREEWGQGGAAAAGTDGCRIAILELDDIAWIFRDAGTEARGREVKAAIAEATRLIEQLGLGRTCRLNEYRLALIVRDEPSLYERLTAMRQRIAAQFPFTATIGLGHSVARIEELPLSFERAKQTIAAKMFLGKDRIIDTVVPNDAIMQDVSDIEHLFERLFRATTNYELVDLFDVLEELFDFVYGLKGKVSIHQFSMYVISKVDTYLRSMKTDFFQILGLEFHQMDDLFHFETIEDIKAWLRRKMFAISEHFYWRTHRPHVKLVNEIKRYLETHMADNISLKDVANEFSFTPNYLGYLFKNEAGEGFSDYLIRIRLEKACELLRNPELKIYEISERVGYRNITYFSSNFKSRYGITPIEYRKKSQ